MRRSVTLLLLLASLVFVQPTAAETVAIEANHDATLIEEPHGALANGAGPAFFVGRTSQAENGVRRALLCFDVAAVVPRRAIVEKVALTLFVFPSNPESRRITLHRVQAAWDEGISTASGGSGAPSQPGDVTWSHRSYDTVFWAHRGGDFIGRASAGLIVAGTGSYTWASTAHLIQDVRLWQSAPHRNFGWILIGDETRRQTAKSFASRESPEPSLRPTLQVTYRMPGEPGWR